ncbi:MAG: PQQ-dependent sugar dehydrogenase [Planctomycetota bacterium]
MRSGSFFIRFVFLTLLLMPSILTGIYLSESEYKFNDPALVPTPTALTQDQPPEDADNASTMTGIGTERAWPSLRFNRPVHLCGAGDDSGRVFVVEQDGVVLVFDGADTEAHSAAVFLDIRDRVSRAGNEEGLIGFAFHPDFRNNGQFFVHYSSSVNDPFGTISRFSVSVDDENIADQASEEILLELEQPFRNHNGGTITFGPDGYLYASFGDGGKANDPLKAGQDLSTLLGKIIRIDVDQTQDGLGYAIPADNPFVEHEQARGEIWALGLRNVWRMAFDRETGELWGGDVGQDKWDEISLIERGGNYGWNRFEADNDFDVEMELATEPHISPVAAYGREWGISVTGGNVYRGRMFPELDGSYFYGDYVTGNLWRITKTNDGSWNNELVRRTGRSIAAFGEDDGGEVFLLSFDGGIYRIVPTAEAENMFADWPEKLSETGLFTSLVRRTPAEHMVRYEVNAPFWSDEADKSRYIALPANGQLEFRDTDSWVVPVGTTIVKNFSFGNGRRMLETRLIKRTATGWESATYVWSKQQDEAILHTEGQQFEIWKRPDSPGVHNVDSWHAPSSSECASCHVDAAGYVLGLNTEQLNRAAYDSDENQIMSWISAGILNAPEDLDVSELPAFCSPYDESADLEQRARVWLDVNCAMCHRPDGPGNANIDLRYATALENSGMHRTPPAQGDLGIENSVLLEPGSPELSLIWHRINTGGAGRMPNIGTNVIDQAAVELIRNWIEGLDVSE